MTMPGARSLKVVRKIARGQIDARPPYARIKLRHPPAVLGIAARGNHLHAAALAERAADARTEDSVTA